MKMFVDVVLRKIHYLSAMQSNTVFTWCVAVYWENCPFLWELQL